MKTKILVHIILVLLFLMIPVLSSPDFGNGQNLFKIKGFLRIFSSHIGVILFFYINYFILIPKLYFKKKYLLFILSILGIFLMVHNVPAMIFGKPKPKFEHSAPRFEQPKPEDFFKDGNRKPPIIPNNIYFQFFFVAFVSLLIRINIRLREVENEKLKSEVSYLKAQINPHFLFNTLNSLYALTIEKSDEAPNAVVKLSYLMRYIINESSKDFVPLKNELEYIENFVGLQKLRLTEKTKLEFEIKNSKNSDFKIAPLLLISFIENAFKYGVNPDLESLIKIMIEVKNNVLSMGVKNTIVADVDEQEKFGIGIRNSRKRLEMIYPKNHKLDIFENDSFYNINLTINLDD